MRSQKSLNSFYFGSYAASVFFGLASWIIEKLRSWSDCNGDVESVFDRDELLTWVMVYWITATIGTSLTPYALMPDLQSDRVEVPTAVSAFPRTIQE